MDAVAALTDLRQEIEQQTGESVADARASVACVLYDVARRLGLNDDETAYVLGSRAWHVINNGHTPRPVRNDCPFGADCAEQGCLMEACPKFGDRWSFVIGFGLEDTLGQAADDSA